MLKQRYLSDNVIEDLDDKMIFVGGPRQVGKTTLARELVGEKIDHYSYLNWDFLEDRKSILGMKFSPDTQLLIFDEIHKYKNWKNFLKGLYDKKKDEYKIMVTGSARLDIFKKGGDSLMGRNYYYRLHPFSLAELLKNPKKWDVSSPLDIPAENAQQREYMKLLDRFGGFPEPLLKQNERTLRRWHQMRLERITREDIRDLENISNMSSLQLLMSMIPSRVGSLLSVNSMTEDLSVTHKTVKHWLDILENLYYHFRIYPFTGSPIKSLKKMAKVFLWDWSEIENNNGAKFENIIASHLLKFCHYLLDAEGYRADLYFLRDLEHREVDFLVTIDQKPWFAVDVKTSSKNISRSLHYFTKRMDIPFAFQVVQEEGIDYIKDDIRVISASRFLAALV